MVALIAVFGISPADCTNGQFLYRAAAATDISTYVLCCSCCCCQRLGHSPVIRPSPDPSQSQTGEVSPVTSQSKCRNDDPANDPSE